jgi:hypothetical protein
MRRLSHTIAALARASIFVAAFAAGSLSPAAAADRSLRVDPMIVEFSSPSDGDQKALVRVANSGSEPERVSAQGVDWHTSFDGAVTIERVGMERDRSLTPYLSISPASFVLQPGETRELALTLHVPAGAAPTLGARWGGFLVRATGLHDTDSSVAPGATVFVYETLGAPRRHLALTALSLHLDRGRSPQLTARFVNDGETYVRPICRLVIERGEALVREVAIPTNVIFPGDKRALRESLEPLPSGDYRLHLIVDYGGGTLLDGAFNVRIP